MSSYNSNGAAELPATEEQKAVSNSPSSSPRSNPPSTTFTSPASSTHHSITFTSRSNFEILYTHETILGAGDQGRVDRYLINSTQKTVAVKTIRSAPYLDLPSAISEVRILTHLNNLPEHSNISKMSRIWDNGTELRIVMPCYPGGDLTSLANRSRIFDLKIPEAFCFHAFSQLACGVSFLHEHGIAHRDIKPQNLLLSPGSSSSIFPDLKIVDFRCAEMKLEEHSAPVGTPRWQPPGVQNLGAKADVWGIGACIYFLCTGMTPKLDYPGGRNRDAINRWYLNTPAKVTRLVHDTEMPTGMSLTEARNATFRSIAPLPMRGYSPLLEYHVSRTLDTDSTMRVSSHALLINVQADAERQITFYQAWVAECDRRPMMQFIYPEPPAGWIPGLGVVL